MATPGLHVDVHVSHHYIDKNDDMYIYIYIQIGIYCTTYNVLE